MLNRVTPLVLTFNEEANIGRVLEQLRWANEVVVVDSGSSDATVELVRSFRNCRVVFNKFISHGDQWKFALNATGIKTEWVLALDADYLVSRDLVSEVRNITPSDEVNGYSVRFKYCVDGYPLRGSIYPPAVVLFRRAFAQYVQTGHTQRIVVTGVVNALNGFIMHDDRKPLVRWMEAQLRYSALEADYLLRTPKSALSFSGKLRLKTKLTPFLVFLYTYIFKLCVLNGRRGLFYSLQRMLAENMIAVELAARQLAEDSRRNHRLLIPFPDRHAESFAVSSTRESRADKEVK